MSIRDYEDYARSFAGIAKAHALWIPSGPARGVFLTVAGIDGAEIKETSDTYHNLLASLRRYGDPLVPLTLRSYRAIPFRIEASIKAAEDAEVDRVLASVEEELRACFGFRSRSFGQPVSVDEVAAAIHGVAGVVAVDIDRLNPIGTAANLRPRLFARLPLAMPQGEPAPAELLVLDAGPIGLGVIV